MSLLSAHGLHRRIGARAVLDGVDLTVETGDRIGLVGRNGAGKTTLLRCLLGQESADDGEIMTRRDLRVAAVGQQPELEGTTVEEAVLAGLAPRPALVRALDALERKMESAAGSALDELVREQAELMEAIERHGGRAFEHEAEAMLDALAAPAPDRSLAPLSLGERRRVALAVGLLAEPELLVLDEPTNHLDVETIERLEGLLTARSGALLLVTHDRWFLDRVCTRIVELDRGRLFGFVGGYTRYLEQKAAREAAEQKAEDNRQKTLRHELEWVRRGPPARTTKSKARLDRYEALAADNPVAEQGEAKFRLPHPSRLGKTILELKGVSKRFSGPPLVQDLDLLLTPGDRLGVVGPNGAGKTTLLRMVLGQIQPDSGEVVLGQNTEIVYADQGRSDLSDERTVIEEVGDGNDSVWVGDQPVSVHGFLGGLGFDGAQQRAKVGTLSGGERTRVALAKRLRRSGNLLILDEPTNDLDLPTLRVLEDALSSYPGCVLVVSHDRWFLDRVTTGVLVFEGEGRVVRYEGGHADWRARRSGPAVSAAPRGGKSAPAQKQTKRLRRSHGEEQEFQKMEANILAAEQRVAELETELSDPEETRRLGPRLPERLRALESSRAQVESLYARWAQLSELDPYG